MHMIRYRNHAHPSPGLERCSEWLAGGALVLLVVAATPASLAQGLSVAHERPLPDPTEAATAAPDRIEMEVRHPVGQDWFLNAEGELHAGHTEWEEAVAGRRLGDGELRVGVQRIPLGGERSHPGAGAAAEAETPKALAPLVERRRTGILYARNGDALRTEAMLHGPLDRASDPAFGAALRLSTHINPTPDLRIEGGVAAAIEGPPAAPGRDHGQAAGGQRVASLEALAATPAVTIQALSAVAAGGDAGARGAHTLEVGIPLRAPGLHPAGRERRGRTPGSVTLRAGHAVSATGTGRRGSSHIRLDWRRDARTALRLHLRRGESHAAGEPAHTPGRVGVSARATL